MNKLLIRPYAPYDYKSVKKLYEDADWFDSITDSEESLKQKIEKDPESILVALDVNLVGTISLIEDGRIAIFFRLVAKKGDDASLIREKLLLKGQSILRRRGYEEVHIVSPEEDENLQEEYKTYGFIKGRRYQWMWKKMIGHFYFKDSFGPTKEELKKWAYGDYYAPNQDFELFVVDDPYFALTLAADPKCNARNFFLSSLYTWVGDNAGRGSEERKTIVSEWLKTAEKSTDERIKKLVERTKELIKDPSTYKYSNWGLSERYALEGYKDE